MIRSGLEDVGMSGRVRRGPRVVASCAALLILLVGRGGTASAQTPADAAEVEAILERYVEDYVSDVTVDRDVLFGVEVEGEWWHVQARPGPEGSPHPVSMGRGAPPDPTFYFTLDRETLGRLDRGELNPETAMVKAFSTDLSPMDVETMEGWQPDDGFLETLLRTSFHFWTRGTPEIIPFGEQYTRFTHGADAVVFYYQPGFRSGWASVKPGQHANEDPRSQTNPFPSLFIVVGGRGMARIGGKEVELEKGQAVLVPAEVPHEFWNPFDVPFETVLLMFGEGA